MTPYADVCNLRGSTQQQPSWLKGHSKKGAISLVRVSQEEAVAPDAQMEKKEEKRKTAHPEESSGKCRLCLGYLLCCLNTL